MASVKVYFVNDSEVKLWGLSGRDRIHRQLIKLGEVEVIENVEAAKDGDSILLLRGDHYFDPRILSAATGLQINSCINLEQSGLVVAMMVDGADGVEEYAAKLSEQQAGFTGFASLFPGDMVEAYDPRLLKYDPPVILPITEESANDLEKEIFDGSYKGVTDFVTKWLWPVPSRHAVEFCVNRGFTANQVTLLSYVLAILTGLAFWHGFFVVGLLSGWFMTFLDTVDGKLARVTVTSSKIGDVMDHGLDLVHPPLWYLAWGIGIEDSMLSHSTVMILFWVILASYIGGRLCEGAFDLWLAPFRLFLWQPVDSVNRLITARRNPNMVLLTLSLFTGRPDIGLYLVASWHILSTLFLCARLAMASREKAARGQLESWFDTVDPEKDLHRLEVRMFTRLAKKRS